MDDPKLKWPHKEMPLFGKTPSGDRIVRQHDGGLKVLAPGQSATEFFYNGPTMAELSKMMDPAQKTSGTVEVCAICWHFEQPLDRDNDTTNWTACKNPDCPIGK